MDTPGIHQRYTLQATERLKLRKQIETLFRTGEAFSVFPLRVIYKLQPVAAPDSPVRAGFSIPKKRIRRAVQRNRIRRLLREAWRLQKHDVYGAVPEGQQLHLFFVYTGTEQFTFPEAQKVVGKAGQRLAGMLRPEAI